jgi:hypothetical protein
MTGETLEGMLANARKGWKKGTGRNDPPAVQSWGRVLSLRNELFRFPLGLNLIFLIVDHFFYLFNKFLGIF